jgi:putative flippase GtrA
MVDANKKKPGQLYARALEPLRFLIGGAANTGFSYSFYLIFLKFIDAVPAYTFSFIIGIFSGYAINTYFVFRSRWSWRRFAAFPAVHIVNYAVGAIVLWIAVNRFNVDEKLAPILSICSTIPINYLLSRKIVKG